LDCKAPKATLAQRELTLRLLGQPARKAFRATSAQQANADSKAMLGKTECKGRKDQRVLTRRLLGLKACKGLLVPKVSRARRSQGHRDRRATSAQRAHKAV
jgi:hypothetical protein